MAALLRNTCLFSDTSPFICKSLVSFSLYLSTLTGNVIKEPSLNTIPPDFDYLIHKYDFSPQTVTKVASCFANSIRPDSLVLSFLKETGFSNTQLEKIVKTKPRLLYSCLEKTIKPKIKIFQEMGFSDTDIAEIFGNDPTILVRDAVKIIHPTLSVLKRLLGSNVDVANLLKKPGWSFFAKLDKIVLPNIDFLNRCGVLMEQISSSLHVYPYFFLVSPNKMKKSIAKVDEMGVERTSKLFIHAARVVSSMTDTSWQLKLKTFMDLGFSEDDISRVFRSSPVVLSVSNNRIKKVKSLLLETGKYDMSCIIKRPVSLMYSIEKRYKPRLQVLRILEKKKRIEKWPCLSALGGLTDVKFFEKYVAPNINELGKELIAKTAVSVKEGREVAQFKHEIIAVIVANGNVPG